MTFVTWLQNLWKDWNLRGAILTSLFLQILLIFIASRRRRTGNIIVAFFIWSAYLLADWFAAFAIGLISNAIRNPEKPPQSDDLLAFWAPFLLLHLGGPDAITAFSLEDNELWLRHLLGFAIQTFAVAFVLFKTWSNELEIPTILMFVAGTIKYYERVRALYLACLGNFKSSMLTPPDAGPNYAQLMEEYSSKKHAGIPVEIQKTIEPTRDSHIIHSVAEQDQRNGIDVVQEGHKFFITFKGLIVDLMFSFQEREESRGFFLKKIADAMEAFKVIEVELNFLYDVLYTKMAVVHNKLGYFLRGVCSVCIAIALWCFVSHNKDDIHKVDRRVTYALLYGAIGLDFIALLKLFFSDWTIVSLKNGKFKSIVSNIREKLSFDKKCRWSNSIYQHSLIKYCLKRRCKWLYKTAELFGAKEFLDELLYKKTETIDEKLEKFIFEELKEKARGAEDSKAAKEICSRRGDGVLSKRHNGVLSKSYASLLWSVQVEYDESLLLWHIATELCYQTIGENNSEEEYIEFCKSLSDYMLYLLVMRPTMMSAVAGIGQIRFQDSCEEVKKFFLRGQVKPTWFTSIGIEKMKKLFCVGQSNSETQPGEGHDERQSKSRGKLKLECEKLLSVDTTVKPIDVKGDRSKSVLFDACILAKKLIKLSGEERWKIMSQVWVELLSYAASHCRADTHAQQISKGGELISFVWLLMAHFGLGEQFRIEAGHARAKLIVGK